MSRSVDEEVNDFLRVNQRLRSQGRTYLRPDMTGLVSQYANAMWKDDLGVYEEKIMETKEMVHEVRSKINNMIDVLNEMITPIRQSLRELKAMDDRYENLSQFQNEKDDMLLGIRYELEDEISLKTSIRMLRNALKHLPSDLEYIYPEAAEFLKITNS